MKQMNGPELFEKRYGETTRYPLPAVCAECKKSGVEEE